MGEPRTRRTAGVVLLLLAVAVTAIAAVAWKLKPESAAYWGSAIGGMFGLAALYLTWASYRDDRAAEKQILTLPEVADQLAVAVRNQWAAEVELRRLNDPYALPVHWEAAPADLVDDWATIERLATGGGVGWPPPPPVGTWASRPEGLAGGHGDLVDVLGRIPTGRLVLLGEPGAGKTVLLARLVVDLLAEGRREPGGPVPVVFPLGSWDPTGPRFDDWLEARVITDYSGLADPVPDSRGKTLARRLWEAGLLLLLLDGLDEIPDAVRGTAVAKINEVVLPGQRLVVTSRTDPYRAAVNPPCEIETRLTGAAGIQLRPLRAADVAAYMRDSAGGPTAAARWEPVLALNSLSSPVAQSLTTPLMAFLARTVYNPRPGENSIMVGRDPGELLDTVRFPTRAAVERHLFDGYLPAAYRGISRTGRWKVADAERWLIFLARHLDHTLGGTPNLAWWQLHQAISPDRPQRRRLAFRLLVGLLAALSFAAGFGFWIGSEGILIGGSWIGLLFALLVGLGEEGQTPRRAMRWRRRRGFSAALMGGLPIGLFVLIAVGSSVGIFAGIVVGSVIGGIVGLGLMGGFWAVPADLARAPNPMSLLLQDRATFRSVILVFGVACWLLFGTLSGFMGGISAGLIAGVVGLAVGFVIGATVGFGNMSWSQFFAARIWLAMHGKLPWNLMAFLDDAHRRGVLRQAGAVYQFRHIELQRRLANR